MLLLLTLAPRSTESARDDVEVEGDMERGTSIGRWGCNCGGAGRCLLHFEKY